MITELLRRVLPRDPAGPVLVGVIGFDPDDGCGRLGLPAGSRIADLDRLDPGAPAWEPDSPDPVDPPGSADPGSVYAAVVVAARTSTDLRRAVPLAALLPDTARVVVAVAESPPHRPLALPAVAPEWRRLRDLRARRRSTGEWWLDVRFSAPMPVADLVAATARGLDGGRPGRPPVPGAAITGPGAADWRPADAAAVPVAMAGPLAGPAGLSPADAVLRSTGAGAPAWTDPRVAAIDRPAPGPLSWAALAGGGTGGQDGTGGADRARGLDAVEPVVAMLSDVHAVPPVDERSVNPAGFVAAPEGETGALVQAGDRWAVTAGGTELLRLPPSGAVTDADVARLRRLRAVEVEWGRHHGPLAAVRVITGLAAAGVPLVAARVPSWARALGDELAALLLAARAADLADELRREEHSVRLRRAALRTHSTQARWTSLAATAGLPRPEPPRISVLLCTRRPDYLRTALGQIARQRHVDLEVVLTLHGVPAANPRVRDAVAGFGRPLTVVEAAAELPFGTALNSGAARASGRHLAKWDDDDWYGPEHLADMTLAMGYSGAEVVGCLSQLVYLEQIDRTVLRPGGASERLTGYVSGGTLVMERAIFEQVGGFRPLRRHVDSGLLRAVTAAGGRVYRTHGLGYLLHRRATGHTWTEPVTHFLRRSTRQWKGFRPSELMELDAAAAPARREDAR